MLKASYISVILPLKLEWEPCYYLPAEYPAESIVAGDRVKVRFSNRIYSAVVSACGIKPETDISRIRPIETREEGLGRILPEEIALWRRVAEYYLCTVGEVYKAAYPASKINLEENHAAALARARERREKILDGMRSKVARIKERLEKKEIMAAAAREGTKSKIRYAEEANKIRNELRLAEAALEAATASAGYDSQAKVWGHTEAHESDMAIRMTQELSRAQQTAYYKTMEAVRNSRPVLLHGVTGSGKTEIYIKAAQETLRSGRNVLYLVPEIALSRQLEERLEQHFGEKLLVFHSAESSASRRYTAEAIRSGNGYITLGTRSSLFLPHHDLGLIIVDEEHDSSYKQDSPAPRYNGRDTALMLSVIHGSGIIMGSATPSLEELYNCITGRHALVELNERFHGSEKSDIEIIDTRAERRKRGMRGSFSIKLIGQINRTLENGGQVMILRSRRAWSTALQCESCGEILRCRHCNVSLSLHKSQSEMGQSPSGNRPDGKVVCHYCGYSEPHTGKCRKCGGQLTALGAGTQKIEEEASLLFPKARIARLDSDTAQNKAYEKQTIRNFAKGEIDILIGTQIVTKGFDFSGVSLVAVIAADTMLGIQDFRADEKAVQMLEQFRGRCGRRGDKGTLVIQTSQPEHPVYQNIISGTSQSDLSSVFLQERKDFGFPPFTRIIEIVIKDIYMDRLQRMSHDLTERLKKELFPKGSQGIFSPVTGPYSPAVDKVADQHIRCIRISLRKDKSLGATKKALKAVISGFEKGRRYDGHIIINVDPV